MHEKTKQQLWLTLAYAGVIFGGGIFIGMTDGWTDTFKINIFVVSLVLPALLFLVASVLGKFDK